MKSIFQNGLLLPVVLLLLVFSTGCTAGMKESYHLRRANKFYAAGEFDRAEIEYLNVIRNNQENFQAISRLGQIYFAEGRVQSASQLLYRAHQMNTNDLEVCLSLARLYQAAGRLTAARDQARFVLDHDPQNPDAAVPLAESAGTSADIAAARKYLNQLPPTASQPELQVALGILAFREKDLKTAGTAFEKARTLDPKSAVAWSALGVLYQQENQTNEAENALKTAADLSPPRSSHRLNYANYEVQSSRPEVADKFLAKTLEKTPDYVSAWVLRAEIALAAKRFDDCSNYLNSARSVDPGNYDVALLNGQLDMSLDEPAKARSELDRLARKYAQVPRVHYLLALTCLANHDVSGAVKSLNRALSLQTNFAEAGLLLAQIEIKNGTPDPAIDLLNGLLENQPDFGQARLLLADAYLAKNEPANALAIYNDMEKTHPQDPTFPLLAGVADRQLQDDGSARQAFSRALELAPESLQVIDSLLELDLAGKQYGPAIAMLEKAMTNSPQKYQLSIMEAQVFEAEGMAGQTVAALQSAIQINPNMASAYLALAQYYSKNQNPRKALDELSVILQKNASNEGALMLKGQVLNGQKDYRAAADTYEQMLAVDPQSSVALNNLAYIYSEYLGQPDKAYDMARKARDLLPLDPSTADTLGWVDFHRGDYASALTLLEESLRRLSKSPDIQYHYGMASYMLGRETQAATALRQALLLNPSFDGHENCQRCLDFLAIDPAHASPADRARLEKRIAEAPGDPVALQRLASIYEQAGDTTRAIQADEAVVKVSPNNVRAMLSLARLYSAGDAAKALAMAKNAYAIEPQNPDVCYVLGRLAFQSGNYKWAQSLLQEAAQGLPGNPGVQYDLARAAYSMGRVDQAGTAFQRALDLGLAAPLSESARQSLDLLAAAEKPDLALAAASRSESILQADPANVLALMVSGLVLEQKSNLNSAGQIYEKVLGIYPDFAPAQKKLALIYAKNSQRSQEAYALAIKARLAFPDDAELSKVLGIILCQQGNYQEAINYLTLSAPARPNDAELFYNLGLAQYHLKYLADSKISLTHALELKLSGQPATDAQRMLREIK